MNPDISTECPWLALPWRRLTDYLRSGRVPPALMLTGIRGLGKTLLAKAFAQRMLCRQPEDDHGCGVCDSCRLVLAGTHPDLLLVEPEEVGKPIKVDLIRETLFRLSLKPHYGGYRVVLLVPADAMNRHAANSVLKTLEEPDAATLFFLVTSTPESLPITVRSRCQNIRVAAPGGADLRYWLRQRGAVDGQVEELGEIAQNAPFRALELLSTDVVARRQKLRQSWCEVATGRLDPVVAASVWEKSPEDTVRWLTGWVEDVIRRRLVPNRSLHNTLEQRESRSVFEGRSLESLFRHLELLARAKRHLGTQINRQLMMEEIAIHWARIGEHAGRSERH